MGEREQRRRRRQAARAAKTGTAKKDEPQDDSGGFFKLLGDIRDKAWPLLLTGGGFLGFVAFAGGAVTWAQFYAAKLPADQAVDALPNDQLLVAGAFVLTAFGVLGSLAVVVVYLISQEGDPTKRMVQGLVALATVESVVVLLMAHESEREWQTVVAGLALVAFAFGAAVVIQKFTSESGQKGKIQLDLQASLQARKGVYFALPGIAVAVSLTAAFVMWEWWVGLAFLAACLLALAAFRVAGVTRQFRWYGVAVFFSVATFGAVASILNALAEPKIAPAALIRKSDGAGEGIQGLYITETSDRIYLGSVATSRCGGRGLRHDSGRLVWIPKSDVEAVTFGARQEPDTASTRAPEMLEDLIATRTKKATKNSTSSVDSTTARRLDLVPGVREEPKVELKTSEVRPGERLEIRGAGFGRNKGTVRIGDKVADVESWSKARIVIRVPTGAKTGRLVVGCPPRGNRPILRVLQPPVAAALATPVSGQVNVFHLDGSASHDEDGRIVSYHWKSGNRTISTGDKVDFRVPRNGEIATVELTVRDSDDLEDHTTVRVGTRTTVLTIPSDVLFCFDCRKLSKGAAGVVRKLRRSVRGATSVTVEGHTDSVGSVAYNKRLGQDRAEEVTKALLRGLGRGAPHITPSSFGESRPRARNLTVRGRALNRRVRILIKRRRVEAGS